MIAFIQLKIVFQLCIQSSIKIKTYESKKVKKTFPYSSLSVTAL